jgi:hypothetical protein
MLKDFLVKPLGVILQEADLITPAQIQVALQDQNQFNHLRLGEILALRGWIKQETADFFAEQWLQMVKKSEKHPLGYYLEFAGLLNEKQIEQILKEQWHTGLKFGAMAVLNGWIKQTTLDFFLNNIADECKSDSPFLEKFSEPIPSKSEILFIGEPHIVIPLSNGKTLIYQNNNNIDQDKPYKVTVEQSNIEDFPTDLDEEIIWLG